MECTTRKTGSTVSPPTSTFSGRTGVDRWAENTAGPPKSPSDAAPVGFRKKQLNIYYCILWEKLQK